MSNMTVESVKIDGVEYRKVDGEARVGDYIIYDKVPYSFLTAGKPYRVVRMDVFGDPQITNDDGGPYDTFTDTYNVYRKVEQTVEESARLTVGDYGKVVSTQCNFYEMGTVVRIISHDGSDIPYRVEDVNGTRQCLREDQLVPATADDFERARDEYQRKQFTEGDRVRLVNGGGAHPLIGFVNGRIYKVSNNDYRHGSGKFGKLIRLEGNGSFGYARPDQLEKVTEPALKVGDYVKVVDDKSTGGEKRRVTFVGEIRKLIEDDGSKIPYKAEKLDGSDYHWFSAEALVRATDEEVAEAKAKLSESRKWAEIGRKPGEYKKGDIIVGKGRISNGYFTGVIEDLLPTGKSAGIWTLGSHEYRSVDIVELVCPVEKRFDQVAESDAE